MEKRFKIISIANHHQWDGLVVTASELLDITKVLELSKWYYDIKVEEVK